MPSRESSGTGSARNRTPARATILVTLHRRESFGPPLEGAFGAIRRLALEKGDRVRIVFPVHPNPNVSGPAAPAASGTCRTSSCVHRSTTPSSSRSSRARVSSISDSGGVQEEAPSLKVPVLIARETTERPEVLESGWGSWSAPTRTGSSTSRGACSTMRGLPGAARRPEPLRRRIRRPANRGSALGRMGRASWSRSSRQDRRPGPREKRPDMKEVCLALDDQPLPGGFCARAKAALESDLLQTSLELRRASEEYEAPRIGVPAFGRAAPRGERRDLRLSGRAGRAARERASLQAGMGGLRRVVASLQAGLEALQAELEATRQERDDAKEKAARSSIRRGSGGSGRSTGGSSGGSGSSRRPRAGRRGLLQGAGRRPRTGRSRPGGSRSRGVSGSRDAPSRRGAPGGRSAPAEIRPCRACPTSSASRSWNGSSSSSARSSSFPGSPTGDIASGT